MNQPFEGTTTLDGYWHVAKRYGPCKKIEKIHYYMVKIFAFWTQKICGPGQLYNLFNTYYQFSMISKDHFALKYFPLYKKDYIMIGYLIRYSLPKRDHSMHCPK